MSPSVKRVIVVPRIGDRAATPWNLERDRWWDEAIAAVDRSGSGAAPLPDATDPETPYMLIYTSGTTGRPKGAVHVHGGFPIKAAAGPRPHVRPAPRRRPVLVHRPRLDDGPVGDRGVAAARRAARALRGRAGLPGPGPALVASSPATASPTSGLSPTVVRALIAHGERAGPRATTSSSLRVLGSTGEPWNPEPWWWYFREVGGGRLPDRQLLRRDGGQRRDRRLQPAQPDQARRRSTGRARAWRRTSSTPTASRVRGDVGELVIRRPHAGHDARLLARPGALPRDVLVALARDLGPRRLGGRSTTTATGTSRAARTTRSRSPASASGRRRSRPRRSPIRRSSRPPRSASRTRSRARRSSSSRSSAAARPTTRSSAPRSPGASSRISARRSGPEAVVVVPALPKTRSGKIMRRVVRAAYLGLDPGDLSALDDPATIAAIAAAADGRPHDGGGGSASMTTEIVRDIVSWDDLADMVGRPRRRRSARPTST